jgi:hypothetical protein
MSELLAGYIPEAEYLIARGIGPRQACRERAARTGPPYVEFGRGCYYYPIDGFRAWLAAREVKPVKRRLAGLPL